MELKKELLEFLEANNLFGLEDRENAEGVVDSYLKVYKKQLTLTDVVKTLKKEHQATLTEYATELINMQENPKDSNKEWKIVLIQNTISKLYETLQTL